MTVAAGAVWRSRGRPGRQRVERRADNIDTLLLQATFKGALAPSYGGAGHRHHRRHPGTSPLYDSLSGTMGLVKIGPNTLILFGTDVNTYTGGTTVAAGTLQAPNTSACRRTTTYLHRTAPGAVLAVNVGTTGDWNSGSTDDIGTLLNHATSMPAPRWASTPPPSPHRRLTFTYPASAPTTAAWD